MKDDELIKQMTGKTFRWNKVSRIKMEGYLFPVQVNTGHHDYYVTGGIVNEPYIQLYIHIDGSETTDTLLMEREELETLLDNNPVRISTGGTYTMVC